MKVLEKTGGGYFCVSTNSFIYSLYQTTLFTTTLCVVPEMLDFKMSIESLLSKFLQGRNFLFIYFKPVSPTATGTGSSQVTESMPQTLQLIVCVREDEETPHHLPHLTTPSLRP